MTECQTVSVPASGKNLTKDIGSVRIGGGDQRTNVTVSFEWCKTHDQPHAVCEEVLDDG